ncbi:MAG: hypothetical protein J0J11_03380, partial [Microbacterium sp.]|nr:hypothetical protein [Microbacterium sp.]
TPIGRDGLDRTFAAAASGDGESAFAATIDTPSRGDWQIVVRASGALGLGGAGLVARAEGGSTLLELSKVFLPPLTLTLLAFGVGRRGMRTRPRMSRRARGGRRPAVSRHAIESTR